MCGRVGTLSFRSSRHRRLSIIDLSNSATQPTSNKDGSLWVLCTEEIYNHAEIRAELEEKEEFLPT